MKIKYNLSRFLKYLLSKLDKKYENIDDQLDHLVDLENIVNSSIEEIEKITNRVIGLKKEFKELKRERSILLEKIASTNQNGFARRCDIVTLLYNIQSATNLVLSKYASLPDYKKMEKNFMDYHVNTRAEIDSLKIMLKNYFKTIQTSKNRTMLESDLYRTLSIGFNKLTDYEESVNNTFDKISKLLDTGYCIQDDVEFISNIVKELPELIKELEAIE
jgi:hypothetical protein